MRTVVWLPSLSSVRIRLNLGQLPRSFLADLGVKESLEVHAALSIRFDDDYTESKLCSTLLLPFLPSSPILLPLSSPRCRHCR